MASAPARRLVLLRHAKSAWPDLPDHDRPLAGRGRGDAPAMGRWLRETGCVPDLVWCSTARRAAQTWQLAAAELGADPPVTYQPAAVRSDRRRACGPRPRRSGGDSIAAARRAQPGHPGPCPQPRGCHRRRPCGRARPGGREISHRSDSRAGVRRRLARAVGGRRAACQLRRAPRAAPLAAAEAGMAGRLERVVARSLSYAGKLVGEDQHE